MDIPLRRKYILMLICLSIGSQLFAQRKAPPVFSSKSEQNNFSPAPGKLFVKVGILNLFHPTAPSLDLGLEYLMNEKLSLELVYGLRTGRVAPGGFLERLYFDEYYKLFGGFRFYPKGRENTSIGVGRFVPSFLAVEGYYSRASTFSVSNFALDNLRDDRIDYASADVEKWVKSFNLKSGYIWKLSNRLGLETSVGAGIIFYRRDYIFYTPTINGQSFSEDLLGPYDDRNIGRVGALHLIANLKLMYKIF